MKKENEIFCENFVYYVFRNSQNGNLYCSHKSMIDQAYYEYYVGGVKTLNILQSFRIGLGNEKTIQSQEELDLVIENMTKHYNNSDKRYIKYNFSASYIASVLKENFYIFYREILVTGEFEHPNFRVKTLTNMYGFAIKKVRNSKN